MIKLGEFKSAIWVILIFFYFTVFTLVVNSASSYSNTINSTSVDYYAGYICDQPRLRFNPANGESKEANFLFRSMLDCDNSQGVLGEKYCDQINGCEWVDYTTNESNYFDHFLYIVTFGWHNDDDLQNYTTCNGTINISGMNTVTKTLGGQTTSFVAKYDESSYYNSPMEDSVDACRHPTVMFNKSACDMLSCTWTSYDVTEKLDSPSGIYNTMGNIFSFRYDFGVENTNIRVLLNLIFVLLPLLILIFAIYFSLPVIH